MIAEGNEFRQYTAKEKLWFFISLILLFFLAFLFLFPLYWMFLGAFEPASVAIKIPPYFLPFHITLDNFRKLFSQTKALRWFINSVIVAGSATLLTLAFASMSGYAFGKKKFPGRELIFWILITAMMVPKQVMMIPLYILMNKYHMYNTYPGMFLPMVAWPFGLFLMKQFMQGIPDDLLLSAKIDGASEIRIFLSIVIPLSIPAFGTVGILYFINTWNDYMWQLVITKNTIMSTLPVGIAKVSRNEFLVDYGLLMSGAAFGAIPMIGIFLFFQKYFISGITMGALKG